jgi:inorganic pyrophosphatase
LTGVFPFAAKITGVCLSASSCSAYNGICGRCRYIGICGGDKVNYCHEDFWNALDELVNTSEIVIDRPKGSAHPRFPDFIYRVDYGYLKNTASMDGAGIDVWVGSGEKKIDAIMCIVDLMKKDSEIKILIGCTEEEKMEVYQTHNETQYMKGILIRR